MSRESPPFLSLPAALELDPSRPGDADPELAGFPRPPRAGKVLAVVVLAAGALAAFAMALALRRDVLYAFGPAAPASLGDLRTTSAAVLASHENGFVQTEGRLGQGIRYERPLFRGTFRARPVVGRAGGDGVWVEARVASRETSGSVEAPRSFVGRLVSFESADLRHRALAKAIEDATGVRVSRGAFLLIEGEDPGGERFALALAAAFLALAVCNAAALARLLRRPR